MGIIEALIAAIVALGAIAAGLFQAWRGAKQREKNAEQWVEAVTETLEHAKRTHAASDKARAEGEKAVESVREAAQSGRRDHFEGQ
jgi:uncharacterized protein YdgA (DUF945 family)